MDQYFRALTGAEAAPDEHVGNRAFTAANLADADPDAGANYGGVDFRAEYLALWGLAG